MCEWKQQPRSSEESGRGVGLGRGVLSRVPAVCSQAWLPALRLWAGLLCGFLLSPLRSGLSRQSQQGQGHRQGCQRQMEVTEGWPPSTPSNPKLLLSGREIYGKFSLSWSDFWDDVLKPDHGGGGEWVHPTIILSVGGGTLSA